LGGGKREGKKNLKKRAFTLALEIKTKEQKKGRETIREKHTSEVELVVLGGLEIQREWNSAGGSVLFWEERCDEIGRKE